MTDPLTYLDEVDARAEAASGRLQSHAKYLREGPHIEPPYSFLDATYGDDLQTVLASLPALSKALRAVLDLPIIDRAKDQIGTHSTNCHEYHAACLAVAVRHRIEAALAVNDEGGAT